MEFDIGSLLLGMGIGMILAALYLNRDAKPIRRFFERNGKL